MKRVVWLALSSLVVAAMLLASCAPAAKPSVTATPRPVTTPAATSPPAPAAKPTTPATATLAPAVTTDKAQYGGILTVSEVSFVYLDTYRYERYSADTISFVGEVLGYADWAIDRNLFNFPDSRGMAPLKYMRGQLLESWEMPDKLTLIFKIRKGVRFQNKPPVNGREFNADDIIWNLERYRKSPFLDKMYTDSYDSVTKIDNYTVKLNLKPPYMAEVVRGLFAFYSLVYWPKEAMGKTGEIEEWRNMIGTGPFMMEDFVPDSAITLKKNPDYYGFDEKNPANRLPYADGARILLIADPSTRYSAMRTGKMDYISEVPFTDASSLLKTAPRLLSRGLPASAPAIAAMMYNIKPYNDVKVRQALNMALDRNEMIKTFFAGHASYYSAELDPSFGPMYTPYEKLSDKPSWTAVSAREVLTYNPEKARKLLAEAGYPNGFKTHIDVTPSRDPGISQMLQSYFAKIGVTAEINTFETGAFNALRRGNTTAIVLIWRSLSPDPFRQMAWYTPRHQSNAGLVDDPKFNDMYNKAVAEQDEAKQAKMLIEMQTYVIENALLIVPPHYEEMIIWQPWVKGYAGEGPLYMFGLGSLMSRVWVDRKTKSSMGL